MPEQVQKVLFDRKTTAELLSISQRTLDHLIADGKLRARRIGDRVLVHRDEVERFARKGAA